MFCQDDNIYLGLKYVLEFSWGKSYFGQRIVHVKAYSIVKVHELFREHSWTV